MRHLLEQGQNSEDPDAHLGNLREDRYRKALAENTKALEGLMGGEKELHRLLATVNVLSDPDKWGDRFVGRLAEKLVPHVANYLDTKERNSAALASILANPTQKQSSPKMYAQN